VQVGVNESIWRGERRVVSVLLEMCSKLFFNGRVESPGTLAAIRVVFSHVGVDVVRGVGECLFAQRLPLFDLI
jgi:hypothetical protein